MIRLGGIFPDHLNLNGDFGNLEVIATQLSWRGIPSETVALSSAEDLDQKLDFIFIGHGSIAAWADIEGAFGRMLPKLANLLTAGTPAMAISTGFEKLVQANFFTNLSLTPLSDRISKFVVFTDADKEVLGYLNTEVDLPMLHREGKLTGSMLHGPLLAKNPDLLEEVLRAITGHAGVTLAPIQAKEKADQLADLISEVWNLERDLASE